MVPFGGDRALEPGNGFLKTFEADQVRADIVVGIAEIRVNLDGALAFGDGLVNLPLEMEGPAEKSVSLGSGVKRERITIEFDGAVIVAFHLRLVGLLQTFPGLRFSFGGHSALSIDNVPRSRQYQPCRGFQLISR